MTRCTGPQSPVRTFPGRTTSTKRPDAAGTEGLIGLGRLRLREHGIPFVTFKRDRLHSFAPGPFGLPGGTP